MAMWNVAKAQMSTWVAECKASNKECMTQRAQHKNGSAWGPLNVHSHGSSSGQMGGGVNGCSDFLIPKGASPMVPLVMADCHLL